MYPSAANVPTGLIRRTPPSAVRTSDDIYMHKSSNTTATAIIILGVHIRREKDFPDAINSVEHLRAKSNKPTSMNLVSFRSRRPCVIGAGRDIMVIITQPAGPSARGPMYRTTPEVFVVNHIE